MGHQWGGRMARGWGRGGQGSDSSKAASDKGSHPEGLGNKELSHGDNVGKRVPGRRTAGDGHEVGERRAGRRGMRGRQWAPWAWGPSMRTRQARKDLHGIPGKMRGLRGL